MLDNQSVHIGDVQRAVRTGLQLRGAKPIVRAGEKLTVGLALGALAAKTDTFRNEHFLMYEVVHGFTDEHAVGEVLAEQLAAIRLRAAGAGDVTVGARHVRAFHARTDGEKAVAGKHIAAHARRGEVGIAREVTDGHVIMPHPVWVVVAEPVTPIITPTAKLGLACDGLEFAGHLEAKIEPVDIRLFTGRLAGDGAAAVAVGGVNPVVQSERKAVHAMLLVALVETGEEYFAYVGAAIAGHVLGVDNVRRGTDEDALAPREHAVGKIQPFEEHC